MRGRRFPVISSSGARVASGCELLHVWRWDSNLGCLQEQQGLLTTGPSLQELKTHVDRTLQTENQSRTKRERNKWRSSLPWVRWRNRSTIITVTTLRPNSQVFRNNDKKEKVIKVQGQPYQEIKL